MIKPPPGYKAVQLDKRTIIHIREDQDEEAVIAKFRNRKIDWNLSYVERYGEDTMRVPIRRAVR